MLCAQTSAVSSSRCSKNLVFSFFVFIPSLLALVPLNLISGEGIVK